MFGVHVSNLNRLVNRLEPILAAYLPPEPPPPLKSRIRDWAAFEPAYPELTEVVIDATEQGIQRPRGKNVKSLTTRKSVNATRSKPRLSLRPTDGWCG